jgi:hypothetical protein
MTASKDMKTNRFLEKPPHRPLKVYAFDPTRGNSLGNHMKLDVRYEPLQPGPVGKYLAVIDYDGSNKCYYQPVDLDDPGILLRNGLDPSESDPQFHQQMVYAVASETIRRFEYALGRSIRWSFARRGKKDDGARQLLRIFPHGMQEANAYYSRELRALVFGYFPASSTDAGDNIPGQTVCTCLAHDIVAHETTHALVDSQKDCFLEATSFDSPAFHEAFADIVGLFQHFSYRDALLEMVMRTGGLIYQKTIGPAFKADDGGAVITQQLDADNPLVGLAKQFGDAVGMRGALRSALGTPPNSSALQRVFEPHLRGSILVAAVFDAFFSIYLNRTADLMRIARMGGLQLSSGELNTNIAKRLVETATKTADHFFNICVRALDYCPPVDILFGDFLRAMITADFDLVPDDKYGYRAALIDAFRSRGIVPESVNSYSEESLRWCRPALVNGDNLPTCEGLQFDVFRESGTEQRRQQQSRNAVILNRFAAANAEALGLSPSEKIQARTFHEVHRVGPDGKLNFDIVAELTQRREILAIPGNPDSKLIFRGGTTLILSRGGEIRYAIQKSIGDPKKNDENQRLARQLDYRRQAQSMLGFSAYATPAELSKSTMNFEMIHRGY